MDLEEVFLKINGRLYLWRAGDQDDEVLDIWSKATEIGSCQEVLSQIIKGIAVCPACDHHRQCSRCRSLTDARYEAEDRIFGALHVGDGLPPGYYSGWRERRRPSFHGYPERSRDIARSEREF